MPQRRNPYVQKSMAILAIVFGKLTSVLPLPVSRTIAVQLGKAAYFLIPRIRKVGLANLDLAYGDDLTLPEKEIILKGAVRNLAIVAAEFSHMPKLAERRFEGYVTVEGLENCDLKRGLLLVGAHLGNWEWMASVLCSRGLKVAEVVRPFDEPLMNRAVDGTRQAGGITTIPKQEAGAEVVRLLKEGWIVGLLADQSPRNNGVPVTFYGESCWATVAPVMVSVRAKVPVHPIAMIRGERGHYTLHIYPEIEMKRSGHLRQDIVENTQRCQDFFEGLVRQYPEQWLWLHRRWKERTRLRREWDAKLLRDKH